MTATHKRTVSLPSEHDAYVDQLVSSGLYASASEVVRAGLRALQERDAAIEKWLRDEVALAYDAMREKPSHALSSPAIFDEIRKRHADCS